ncbi:MAG TPA: FxsA family protein [Lacipirellulaceae bacterium]|jgi:UPF0716 protein FxsA
MGFYLFLLFTVVPLVELWLLVVLGQWTHAWVPILLILVDAALGTALIRWQGVRVVRRIQEDLAAGRMPGDALIDGALFLIAAALLIAPGILTDCVGFALLIPPLRALVKRGVKAWLRHHVEVRTATIRDAFAAGNATSQSPDHDQIIDAHVVNTRVEDVR